MTPAGSCVVEVDGYSVLIGRGLFKVVMDLRGDVGAGALLSTLGDRLALVEAPDDGVLFDVDQRKE